MCKRLCMVIISLGIVLSIVISTVQASQPAQVDNIDSSQISSAYPLNRWETSYISSYLDAGSNISIAFDPDHDNAAWVSYFNTTFNSLWVAHYVGDSGGNCGPSSTWYCVQVDQETNETKGWFTSIDVFPDINPNPLISTWKVGVSYYDATNESLKYAQYRCPPLNPCSWTISTVDDPDAGEDVGRYTSLKFSPNGIPYIAYYVNWYPIADFRDVYLAFFVGSDGNCGDGNDWHCETVDFYNLPNFGLHPSLDIDRNGTVYIAYHGNGSLKYAYFAGAGLGYCGDYDAWICQNIDYLAGDNVGLFPSLHAPQDSSDTFRVAYYDATHGKLKYAYARGDTLGNCGPGNSWQCTTIDDMGVGLSWASISLAVDDNNKPMIAYTDASEDLAPLGLKVAEPAYGQPYANCAGEILYDWYCGHLDNGNAYVDDGRFAALVIKPGGLAMIAYSEQEIDYPGSYDLKFAYQTLWSFLPVTLKSP